MKGVVRILLSISFIVACGVFATLMAASGAAAATPTITLSVDSGPPGTPVTIMGTGFPPGEIVALYIDQPSVFLDVPGPHADAQGSIKEQISWPGKGYDPSGRVKPDAAGTHQVCGDTSLPTTVQPVQAKACAPYLVPNPPPGASQTNFPQLAVLSIVAFGVLILGAMAVILRTRKNPA